MPDLFETLARSPANSDFEQLNPLPKWKLIVDLGSDPSKPPTDSANPSEVIPVTKTASHNAESTDQVTLNNLVQLIQQQMPANASAQSAPYLSAFTSLRLLLIKANKSQPENELVNLLVKSFTLYLSSGRSQSELALLMVQEYLSQCQSRLV